MRNLNNNLPNSKTLIRFLMLIAVLSSLTALIPLSTGAAPPLNLTVVNDSGKEIRHLYLSPANNDNWGTDQLNQSPISSGSTRALSLSWDQATVKLVGEDQDGCFFYNTIETAGNPVWTIASNAPRDCGD